MAFKLTSLYLNSSQVERESPLGLTLAYSLHPGPSQAEWWIL